MRLVTGWPAGSDIVQVHTASMQRPQSLCVLADGALYCVRQQWGSKTPPADPPHCHVTGPACLQVASVSGAADSSKAEKSVQLRLEGRSLVQALEAVERELAPAAP